MATIQASVRSTVQCLCPVAAKSRTSVQSIGTIKSETRSTVGASRFISHSTRSTVSATTTLRQTVRAIVSAGYYSSPPRVVGPVPAGSGSLSSTGAPGVVASGFASIVNVGPTATLVGPMGAVDYTSLMVSTACDEGWRWSATVRGSLDISDAVFAPDAPFWIVLNDGFGNEFRSTALVAHTRGADDTYNSARVTSSLSGSCLTSYRMARGAEDFPTFKSAQSTDMLATLAARASVAVPQGAPKYGVLDEDWKQTKLADALNRVLSSQGYEWVVDPAGILQCYPYEQPSGSLSSYFDWATLRRQIQMNRRYTKIGIGKRSAIAGGGGANSASSGRFTFPFKQALYTTVALPNPMAQPLICSNVPNGLGFVAAVWLWAGDPTAGGQLVGFQQLVFGSGIGPYNTPTLQAAFTAPVTHISCDVRPSNQLGQILTAEYTNCALAVQGQPSAVVKAIGVDTAFHFTYDTGDPTVLAAPDWVDSIFPTRSGMLARSSAILWAKRKGYDSLSMSGQMNLIPHLRQAFNYRGGQFKIDKIEHTYSTEGGPPRTNLSLCRFA